MRDQWEGPIIELSRPLTAYVLWLIANDLGRWGADRRSRLDRDEAIVLAHYLSDFLPPEMRTEIKPQVLLHAG